MRRVRVTCPAASGMESAEPMRSAQTASRSCRARPPTHAPQNCPGRGNHSGARLSGQEGRWEDLAVSVERAWPKHRKARRSGKRANGCVSSASLLLPQETPRLAYQEAHHRFLSSVASRLTVGKSPGGAPSGVASAIDAGRTRTAQSAWLIRRAVSNRLIAQTLILVASDSSQPSRRRRTRRSENLDTSSAFPPRCKPVLNQ